MTRKVATGCWATRRLSAEWGAGCWVVAGVDMNHFLPVGHPHRLTAIESHASYSQGEDRRNHYRTNGLFMGHTFLTNFREHLPSTSFSGLSGREALCDLYLQDSLGQLGAKP